MDRDHEALFMQSEVETHTNSNDVPTTAVTASFGEYTVFLGARCRFLLAVILQGVLQVVHVLIVPAQVQDTLTIVVYGGEHTLDSIFTKRVASIFFVFVRFVSAADVFPSDRFHIRKLPLTARSRHPDNHPKK